jgi:CTP synthase (UTP-ammonia lyase)
MKQVHIGIIGDYDPDYLFHRATGAALEASGRRLSIEIDYQWVATDSLAPADVDCLAAYDGLWASPGSPYRSLDGALAAIRYARERDRPFIGT